MKFYLDEPTHTYYDTDGAIYLSVTTLISKFYKEFNSNSIAKHCAAIGKRPEHPKYWKYQNKTKREILNQWNMLSKVACERGNRIHSELERSIKFSNAYYANTMDYERDRLFTIQDILDGTSVGVVNMGKLSKTPMATVYTDIFKLVKVLANDGYRFYAEVAVYNRENNTAGLIDLLAIKGKNFIIIDYKSNRNPIVKKAGYFEKDFDGNIIGDFIHTKEMFTLPLSHIEASVFNKYSLQLSKYAQMIEEFDSSFKCEGLMLCHIQDNTVDIRYMPYLKEEIIKLTNYYFDVSQYIDFSSTPKKFNKLSDFAN